jgi:hypothetical protein
MQSTKSNNFKQKSFTRIKKRNNLNKKVESTNHNLKITQKKPPKKVKNSQNSESISNQKESQFNLFSQSREF